MHRPRSIQRSLLLWIWIPLILLWATGNSVIWLAARYHANMVLEESLSVQARTLASHIEPGMPPQEALTTISDSARMLQELAPKAHFAWQVLVQPGNLTSSSAAIAAPQQALPDPLPADTPVFYNATLAGQTYRAVVLNHPFAHNADFPVVQIQIARHMAPAQAHAWRLFLYIALPMTALVLLLGTGMVLAARRKLMPLHRLVDEIDGIRGGALHPIVVPQAPQEVQAITHALNHLLSSVQNNVDNEKRFINDAAHQLRTPLAGLISQAELALGENDCDKLRQRIGKMHGAARRSAHLVQQMLALARTEGTTSQKRETYDLAVLAREVAREWTPRALTAGIDLGYEGDDEALVVGDRVLMREAIGNLIDNAIQYAGHAAEVTVSVRQQNQQQRVLLAVMDNGPGVPPEHLPRLFQRFWRADDSAPGGCGIGLALVSKVAAQHRGTASASLAQPHGLAVWIDLPEATASTNALAEPSPAHWDYE